MPTYKHYFIRHAHRSPFLPEDWGHDVSITEEGKQAARQMGDALSQLPIKTLWTSPIKRCVQTAEEMRKGISCELPIYSSPLLGDPGFIISNPQLAEPAFQKYTLYELMNDILANKTIPGFYSIEEGCKRMLEQLLKRRKEGTIWISHDITVCLLACWIFQCQRAEELMPDFLEGIEFTFNNTEIQAHFKGFKAIIDETSSCSI